MAIWDVSQNVDRFKTDFGLLPCITPGGMDFATNRLDQLNGSELLLIQGMPLDRLLFGGETQRERQDLAGNAMSTTVIGASLISAITCGWRALRPRHPSSTNRSIMDLHDRAVPEMPPTDDELLQQFRLDPEPPQLLDLNMLKHDASSSARHCHCEGSDSVSTRSVRICSACEHTACTECAGLPKHVYQETVSRTAARRTPHDFTRNWRPKLPARVKFDVFPDISEVALHLETPDPPPDFLRTIADASIRSLFFRMQSLSRREHHWKVTYKSHTARLELNIGRKIQWLLFVHCPKTISGNDPLRKLLDVPVACGTVHDSLLNPDWEVHIPSSEEHYLEITSSSRRISSWKSRLGLVDYKEETVPAEIQIQVNTPQLHAVEGLFQHLPHCGTASNSLYKRTTGTALYMFLESHPTGLAQDDSFIFSRECGHKEYGEHRISLGHMDSTWRPSHLHHGSTQHIRTTVTGTWSAAEINLRSACIPINVGRLTQEGAPRSINGDCSQAVSFWNLALQGAHTTNTFEDYSWAVRRALGRPETLPSFSEWQAISASRDLDCSCAPAYPELSWSVDSKSKAMAHEDRKAAADFERAIKTRSPIFQLRTTSSATETRIHVGISLAAIGHRVQGGFADAQDVVVACRLITDHEEHLVQEFTPFYLQNNADAVSFGVPPTLEYLYPTQRKSLSWMLSQESGQQIILTEVEEAVHYDLGWRVEARAQATRTVRGGVLADHPSFGKTVTTIALIQNEFTQHTIESLKTRVRAFTSSSPALIPLASTLIVCPPHIALQWQTEFAKFLDVKQLAIYTIIVIQTCTQLRHLTIDDIQKSRVIIVSWALFAEEEYVADLAQFAAMPEPVMTSRRAFNAWMRRATEALPKRLAVLLKHGYQQFRPSTDEELRKNLDDEEFKANLPLKVRHGSAYRSFGATSRPTTSKSKCPKKLRALSSATHAVPLLHLFAFNRIVVDEYHYLEDVKKIQSTLAATSIKHVTAVKRWVLSGTPALSNVRRPRCEFRVYVH